MSDPYAETDIWPVPARNWTLTASEPENAPTPTPEADGAREALVEQLAEAMHRACCAGPDWRSCRYDSNLAWERFAEAAAARVEAAVSVWRQDWQGALNSAREWKARAESAEADLHALREKVARVEAWIEKLRAGLLQGGQNDRIRWSAAVALLYDFDHCLRLAGCAPAPVSSGEAWVDRHGDVWTFDEDGIGTSPECANFSRKYVEKKWGPLRPAPVVAPSTEGSE